MKKVAILISIVTVITGQINLEELEAKLQLILDETNTPGMIGSMVVGNEVIWIGSLGLADRESQRSVTEETLFRIGSITKTFTSLAALKLVDQGKIDLNIELNHLLPGIGLVNPWQDTDPIRLHHVLEHTAGFDDIHLREYAFSDPDVTLLDGILYNTTSRIARWRPGTRMSYSNIGPAIGGLAIARVIDERFEDFVQREIFDVLGMISITYFHHPLVASSYQADGETPSPYIHIAARPSGSIGTTAIDMAQLLKMFIHRGTIDGVTFLRPERIDRMEQATGTLAANAGLVAGYGLSNMYEDKDGFIFHGHGGGIDGFVSNYGYLTEHKRGYFFSINARKFNAFQKIDSTIRTYLTRNLQPAIPTPIDTSRDISGLSGYYQPHSPRMELIKGFEQLVGTMIISVNDNVLTMAPLFGEANHYLPVGNNQFRNKDGSVATLIALKSQDGEQLLQGMSTHIKIPGTLAWFRWVLAILSILLIISSILFALIWLPRKFFFSADIHYVSFRAWPALASTSFMASAIIVILTGLGDAIERLGKLTLWSGGYWILTWVFAGCCLISLVMLWRHHGRDISSALRWYTIAVTCANTIVLAYLGYFGFIGLRFWAY